MGGFRFPLLVVCWFGLDDLLTAGWLLVYCSCLDWANGWIALISLWVYCVVWLNCVL